MSTGSSSEVLEKPNTAITCIVGDETGILKSVYFPNVFAKKSDYENIGASKRKAKRPDYSKRRKTGRNGSYADESGFDSETDVVIDEQDRIHLEEEKERKKKFIAAIKPRSTRINPATTQARSVGIDALCVEQNNETEDTFVTVATRNGIVQEWSLQKQQMIAQTKLQHFNVPGAMTKMKSPSRRKNASKASNSNLPMYSALNGVEKIVGICNVNKSSGGNKNIATCSNFGNLRINALPSSDNVENHFSVGQPISKMRQCPSNLDVIAVGGKQLDLRLYSLEGKKRIWKARNVPNDWLNMPVPVWVCDIDFFQDSKNNSNVNNGGNAGNHKLVVGTGYSEIRIYDVRAGEKPVHFYKFPNVENNDKPPFMSVCAAPDGKSIFAGDTQGRVMRVDVGTGKVICHYKGFTGSIRRLQVHPVQQNVLLSISIDRMLRVHHIETRKLLMRMYLKQRLNAMETL